MENAINLTEVKNIKYFGSKLSSFYAPQPVKGKIECWVKIFTMIYFFYKNPKNIERGNIFYISTKKICEKLNKEYHNHYHKKTVQKAIRKLEDEGLIYINHIDIYDDKTGEFKYIKREIRVNFELADKIFSIIDPHDDYLKSLKPKARLKKLILKRPFCLTSGLDKALEKAKKRGMNYKNIDELLASFIFKISKNYLYTDSFFKKFTPSFLNDSKKEQENSFVGKPVPFDRILSVEEIHYLQVLKRHDLRKYNKIMDKLVNNYKVLDDEAIEILDNLGYTANYCSDYIIKPKKTEPDNGGFREL